jgi:hypothetical protein
MARGSKARQAALKYGYRSGLEVKVSEQLQMAGQKVRYEIFKIPYQKPVSNYTPDFLLENGIIIETKGRFMGADRTKHLLIKKQYGDRYDIRFVFTNSKAKLTKTSKTTYGQWCDKNGFKYSDKTIPESWLKEKYKHE